ncbi:hypothetical protein QJS10_CPB20g00917 [Acorus calamus]|uniref:Uncharacterized protein n=1 Tax=Acorus calamus TaxID=4465 RepID=A0AAV9CA26_ACOCL|nr:hypothetical protein QJS10_CPB20g00917 [Acorus calamus]
MKREVEQRPPSSVFNVEHPQDPGPPLREGQGKNQDQSKQSKAGWGGGGDEEGSSLRRRRWNRCRGRRDGGGRGTSAAAGGSGSEPAIKDVIVLMKSQSIQQEIESLCKCLLFAHGRPLPM